MVYNALTDGVVLGAIDTQWHALITPSLAPSLFALAFYLTSLGPHRVADPRQR